MPDGTPFLIESTEPRDPSWEELSLDRACGIGAAGARLGESRTGLGDATPVLVRILIRTTYCPNVPSVRALALAVIRRPETGQLFVDEVVEPGTKRTFHRPAGGGIEFGEPAARTLERELIEEYGLSITVGPQLGALENHFTYAGQVGHEIVLVYEARLSHPADYEQDRRACLDQPHITGVWRRPTGETIPLYPPGLAGLLEATRPEWLRETGRRPVRAPSRSFAPGT